jgi:hypothetical protein
MAEIQELLDAIDQRILEALAAKVPGESIARLAEARAWITHPNQPHGGSSAQG